MARQRTIRETKEEIFASLEEIQLAKKQIDTLSAELTQIQENSKLAEQEVQNYKNSTKLQLDDVQNNLNIIRSESERLSDLVIQSSETQSSLQENLRQAEIFKSDFIQQKETIDNNIISINDAKNNFDSYKSSAQITHTELNEQNASLVQTLSDVSKKHTEIENLYGNLLEDKDSNGKKKLSLNTRIIELFNNYDQKVTEIKNFLESNNQSFSNLKDSLEKEIKELLPAAGAAGLASAYYQAKTRYGYDQNPERKSVGTRVLDIIFNGSNWKAMFNYALFIVPVYFMYDAFKDINFAELVQEANFYRIMFFKLTITLPLFFISLFGFSSIGLSRRLYEEYNHKQRVMQLYHAFKEQIDNQGDKKLKAQLLEIMLNVVKDKPSLAMTEYDKTFFEKLWPFTRKANDNSLDIKAAAESLKDGVREAKDMVSVARESLG